MRSGPCQSSRSEVASGDDLSPGYRSIPVDPVVIVYRIAADAVEVVRVIDGRRDFGTIFGGG